jgi:hypothetical protein
MIKIELFFSMFVLANNQLITMSYYGEPGIVDAVWAKATKIRGEDPDYIRMDAGGNEIWRSHYGWGWSEYGWDIDHIWPKSRGGGDELDNLQPLQCQVNRRCGNRDDKPVLGQKRSGGLRHQHHVAQLGGKTIQPITNGRLYIDKVFHVKQTPRVKTPSLAIIKAIHKSSMTVHWVYADYDQELVNDRNLIVDPPVEDSVRRSARAHV